jgi:hypothetical protein
MFFSIIYFFFSLSSRAPSHLEWRDSLPSINTAKQAANHAIPDVMVRGRKERRKSKLLLLLR